MTIVIALVLFLPVPAVLFYLIFLALGLAQQWALIAAAVITLAVILPVFTRTLHARLVRRDLERRRLK